MPHISLVLPYAVEDTDRKKTFGYDLEVATVLCLAEAKRKKGGILGGSPEKVSFILKTHYPLWAFPWEKNSLIIDGLEFFSSTVTYTRPPDIEYFTEDLKRNASVRELYKGALKRHAKTFEKFLTSTQIHLEAIMGEKTFLYDLLEHTKRGRVLKKREKPPSLIPPKLDEKTMQEKAEKLTNLWRQAQSEIKGFQYATNLLREETALHKQKILQEIEEIQEWYQKEILRVRPLVEKRVEQLTKDLDKKIDLETKTAERELKSLLKKRDRCQRELQKLERKMDNYQQRLDARRRKGDKKGVSRWDNRIKKCKREMSDLEKGTHTLSQLIESTRREHDTKTEGLKENYQTLIYQEKKKITDLENSRDSQTATKQEEVKELDSLTSPIIDAIQRLTEQKALQASELEGLRVPWKLETITLVYIPLYLVRYEIEAKSRYEIFPPAIAKDYKGILKRIQRALWSFSLESRINLLLSPRSKSFEDMFTSIIPRKIKESQDLEKVIDEMGYPNSLLETPNLKEKMVKGMEELEAEGWISPEEKNLVLDKCALQLRQPSQQE